MVRYGIPGPRIGPEFRTPRTGLARPKNQSRPVTRTEITRTDPRTTLYEPTFSADSEFEVGFYVAHRNLELEGHLCQNDPAR